MRIIQKSSKKPLILASVAIAILLVASLSYYVFAMNGNLFGWQLHPETSEEEKDDSKKDQKVDMDPATDDQQQAGEGTKEQTVENEGKSEESQPSTLSVSFTSTAQAGNTLRIRAIIQQVVTGACTLKLTMDNKTVTKTAATYPNASATTCQGFDIPLSELSSGKWNATLNVTAGKSTGSATTTVNVEK